MCLFLCQYQAVLISVALEYSLISGIVIPPTLSFFLKIALAPCGHLLFHINFLIGLFVFLEWSCVSSVYILEIKTLSELSLSHIFSHRVGSLFILLVFSLAMQKLFSCM